MSSLFISTPIHPSGHSWTITTKFGDILRTAESKYGDRDKSYTLLGVEFTTLGNPQIWYPGNCNHIAIQITIECLQDMNRAVFQMAHEAVHCLCPTGTARANYLEEGLACYFSIEYTKEHGHGVNWSYVGIKYQKALEYVKSLLAIDSEIIRKVRQNEPVLALVTKELLIEVNHKIPHDLAEKLTEEF
jgi:hypothetical protein